MISLGCVKRYYCDDISLIENYDKAINDKSQTWVCHHRLETELNLSAKELIDTGRYYKVPASELIFLTVSEHTSLHNIGAKNHMYGLRGKENPNYGKHLSEETRNNMRIAALNRKPCSEETRRKFSIATKGEKNPMYGKHWKLENGRRVYY